MPTNLLDSESSRRHGYGSFEALMTDGGYTTDGTNRTSQRKKNPRKKKNKHKWFQEAVHEKYEALDYDYLENELVIAEENSVEFANLISRRNRDRWTIAILIGFVTALIGVFVTLVVEQLVNMKFKSINGYMQACAKRDVIETKLEQSSSSSSTTQSTTNISTSTPTFIQDIDEAFASTAHSCNFAILLGWMAVDVLLVTITALVTVLVAPIAAGSGIPQIKCFLNGVKMPGVLRFKTLLVKILGIIAGTFGGLALGKEGPLVHAGAVVAGGISQGRAFLCNIDLKVFEFFRSDREKRDFVSAGAAAGVAAAFNAPIGGVLFSMEEGSSFWTQQLTWRTFVSSMTCYVTFNAIMSAASGQFGQLAWYGLADFGIITNVTISLAEIPLFIFMGAIGGASGALFNALNFRITVFRGHYIKTRLAKVLDAGLVAFVTTFIYFLLIVYYNSCTKHSFPLNVGLTPPTLYCPNNEIPQMSAIILQSPESAVRTMVHAHSSFFTMDTLLLFVIVYYGLACVTYGLSVPSGIFVPQVLIGACWGRLFVGLVLTLFPSIPITTLDPAKYAVIGAAAQLGGVVRMTISLVVIIMESIQSLQMGLPLMLAVWTAKVVGDYFNKGLYDKTIEIAEIPLLDWEPPSQASTIPASRIMSNAVKVVRVQENVDYIFDLLDQTTHHGFPVVAADVPVERILAAFDEQSQFTLEDENKAPLGFGQLVGFITREQLIVLLSERAFLHDATPFPELVKLKTFRAPYPKYQARLENLVLTPSDLSESIDLSPYMDRSPYTIGRNCSLRKLHSLFRQLGLRHVTVCDKSNNQVIGMTTRKDVVRFRERQLPGTHQYRIHEIPINTEIV